MTNGTKRDGLTKAQINGLEWLYVDGSPHCHYGGLRDPALGTLRSLVRKGLAKRVVGCSPWDRDHFAFTDAGRAALGGNADE